MKSYYLASRKRPPHARRGAVMVYVSVSLVVVLSFVAFCVDTGWITSTKSELQNVADASAAAGARQLMDNYGSYLIPSQTNRKRLVLDSRTRAADFSTQYGKLNRAGGVKEMAILPDDIQIGYTDANGVFSTSYSGYPNTVQVIARRDSSANGTLPLF
ncbi:MAG: hypothetical protein FJ267_05160, partial [Planctomycetes bacterium]|nr:hypothetical protein [Planctomycetota bacterium]